MILLVALEDCRMCRLRRISRCTWWPNRTSETEIIGIFSTDKVESILLRYIWQRLFENAVSPHRRWISTMPPGRSCTLSWLLVIWRACDWPLIEAPGTVQRAGSRAISQSSRSDSPWEDTPSAVDLQAVWDTLDWQNNPRDHLVSYPAHSPTPAKR